MNITIRQNACEGFDLIDQDSDQSHDGDNAKEWIATVYDRKKAEQIARLLMRQGEAEDILRYMLPDYKAEIRRSASRYNQNVDFSKLPIVVRAENYLNT